MKSISSLKFKKIIFFLFGFTFFILLFSLLKFYYKEQFPDWVSYKNIYTDGNSYIKESGLDMIFILIVDFCNNLGLDYENFRILILFFISYFFLRGISEFSWNVIGYLTILNFIFIFFQIREGFAVSILYFAFSRKNKTEIFLLNIIALFSHFSSIIFVLIAKQNKKVIKFIVVSSSIVLCISFSFFYSILANYLTRYYGHNFMEIDKRDIIYSKYFFITPFLYMLLVKKIKARDFLFFFFMAVLIFSSIYPFLFSFLKIPLIVFNSFYRFVVIYISFMVLEKKVNPDSFSYLIILIILLKDLISSQILYE